MKFVLLICSGLLTQSPELLLEEAFYKETAAVDPDGAIQGYESLVSNPAASPRILAIAHVRLGICRRLRGDLDEAKKHFEAVIRSYPDETEAVKLARRYLGQPIVDAPARFLPADVLLYVELVEPAEHIGALSELVQGTPFQNPVDYYVSYLAQHSSDHLDVPPALEQKSGDVSRAAAFLNEGFLREMQKIGGLALAIPGERERKDEFIAILLPGASDILRGLVQMALTLSKAKGTSWVRDIPVFQVPPEHPETPADSCLHIALGKQVIILGRPRRLVEDALARYAGSGPSLADDPDFRRAQGGRSGSLLFAYLRHERALEALREAAEPKAGPVFDALRATLCLDRVHSLSFSLWRTSALDSLRFAFRGQIGQGLEIPSLIPSGQMEAWRAFATQPLSREVLRVVPSTSLAFLAARLGNGPERVEVFYRAAHQFLELLPPDRSPEARQKLEDLHAFLTCRAAREFLEALDEAVVGIGDELRLGEPTSLFAGARFKDASRGAQVLEELLTSFFSQFIQNSASREFRSETVTIHGKGTLVRCLEPFPGTKLWCHRLEDLFVLTLSEQLLIDTEEAFRSGKNASLEPLPPGASKVLFLRPAALTKDRCPSPEFPREMKMLLSEVGRALFTTREGKESFSLELTVPQVTPTLRAILSKLADLQAAKEEKKERKEEKK